MIDQNKVIASFNYINTDFETLRKDIEGVIVVRKMSLLGHIDTGHDACPPRPNNEASPDVFVDGIPVHRVGDGWSAHGCDDHPPHGATTVSGSSFVFINGQPSSFIGSAVSCGSSIAQGSDYVFIDE